MLQLLLEKIFLRWTTPALANLPRAVVAVPSATTPQQEWLWFAVPKSRVTRHKKRLKTTWQKRIPLRTDIVTDPRTGEMTRLHRLPTHWKDYLPNSTTA